MYQSTQVELSWSVHNQNLLVIPSWAKWMMLGRISAVLFCYGSRFTGSACVSTCGRICRNHLLHGDACGHTMQRRHSECAYMCSELGSSWARINCILFMAIIMSARQDCLQMELMVTMMMMEMMGLHWCGVCFWVRLLFNLLKSWSRGFFRPHLTFHTFYTGLLYGSFTLILRLRVDDVHTCCILSTSLQGYYMLVNIPTRDDAKD